MKSYKELADKIFERRDKYLVARKRKKKKIIKRTSATLCALVVVLGISAWHLEWFKPNAPTVNTQTGEYYDGNNDNISGFEILLTTTESPTAIPIPEATMQGTNISTTTTQVVTWPKYTTTTTFHYKYEINESGLRQTLVDGDDVHFVFSGIYYVLDTNTGQYVKQMELPAAIGEMVYIDDEIWASYPSLQSIYIYNKATLALKRTIVTPHPVSDFAVYGDYLVYATSTFNDHVYRYNMVTEEIAYFVANQQQTNGRWSSEDKFTEPGILIDESRKYVYIGESGTTSCGLYCFDIETMEQVVYHWIHGEICNSSNKIFLINDKLYWGECEFDADDISTILWGEQFVGVRKLEYVDERFIYTVSGFGDVYDRVTKEFIYRDMNEINHYSKPTLLAVTASGNSFKYKRTGINGGAYIYVVPGEYRK